ncbi:MAG TPA: hypothetical protein VMR81_04760 [Patescibacteria group bacterium]|nr:hypothetical protein [Patescibacteria group bacterium]
MTTPEEIKATPDKQYYETRESSLEIPPVIKKHGSYAYFPVVEDAGQSSLAGIKIKGTSHGSLLFPSFTYNGDPVILSMSNQPTSDDPKNYRYNLEGHGLLIPHYGVFKNKNLNIYQPSNTPWNIEAHGSVIAQAHYDASDQAMWIMITNRTLPISVHLDRKQTCSFLVESEKIFYDLLFRDFSDYYDPTMKEKHPHAFVRFPNHHEMELTESHRTQSWVMNGKDLCTFSFLTPAQQPITPTATE